jgi:hypothetical protein
MDELGHYDEQKDNAEIIDSLFCRENAPYVGFAREGDALPSTIVPRRMFRVPLVRADSPSDRYEVTVFLQIRGFAGTLWEAAARTLVRLGPIDHPALPSVEMAKAMPERGLAFTLTKVMGAQANFDTIMRWADANPAAAFEQFTILLDAVKQLHGSRILHRCLVPDAIRVILPRDASDPGRRLVLGRFEMSMLIGNLIRRAAREDSEEVRWMIRQLYLNPEDAEIGFNAAESSRRRVRHLAYLAPEMHEYLLNDAAIRHQNWETTDLFGLGVLGWELFCGALQETLPEQFAAVQQAEGTAAVEALVELHGAMRDHLRRCTDVRPTLQESLLQMIEHRPDGRQTSFQIADKLNSNWEDIYSTWTDRPDTPYLVAYMPDENTELHDRWGWVSRSPEDPAGRQEMQEFFREELSEANVVRSLRGAQGYATGDAATLREAEWVLIGHRAVWFCTFMKEYEFDGSVRRQYDEILLIKYLRENNQAKELYGAQPRREVPAVDVIPFQPGQALNHQVQDRPSWRSLTDTLTLTTGLGPEDQELVDSLDFLLQYQAAQIDARVYPYVVESTDAAQAVLRFDPERDHKWRNRNALLTAYATSEERRPPLGEFAEQLDDDEDLAAVYFQLDEAEMPRWTRDSGRRVKFSKAISLDSIMVETEGRVLETKGWLRPESDIGNQTQLGRQIRARQALQHQRGLIRMLRDPIAHDLSRGSSFTDRRIDELRGNARTVIRHMLQMYPIYVLQGPPGSGKTTAAAHALRVFLDQEKGARVLVSAQSNFALDNLAAQLIKELPEDKFIVLRETPERDPLKRVKDAIKPKTISLMSENLADAIRRKLAPESQAEMETVLSQDGDQTEHAERQLREQWVKALEQDNLLELTERVRAGASVVLATCSIAAAVLDRSRYRGDVFDWVIVEEAAKAWPTELIVPLVQGSRWTLIGDHRQLGAHKADMLARFLDSLADYPDETVQQYYEDRAQHLHYLALFASFFAPSLPKKPTDGAAAAPAADSRFLKELHGQARGRLNRQFRMHPDIAQPVSRAFYRDDAKKPDADGLPQSFLKSDEIARKPHGLTRPEKFDGHSLIWLNTNGVSDCLEVPRWYNPGEVDIIDRVVRAMSPAPAEPGDEGEGSLVVLTPYRAQLMELARRNALADRVHTVHSFQGREADRVIVSLVRARWVSHDPVRNVGHVGQDEVINVLLSRAMRLMILVGNLEHFGTHGGDSWAEVVKVVLRYGLVLPADDWEYG